jgi:hypothetical protein
MQGQFIFSTCNQAGLRLNVLLRNTLRDEKLNADTSNLQDMKVSLKIFCEGELECEYPQFALIPSGGYAELSEITCPILRNQDKEFLLVALCQRGEFEGYFAQEHQVVYQDRQASKTTSLLYDQMPVGFSMSKPILLLAPKVWISEDVNTFINILNAGTLIPESIKENPWKIDFFLQNGKRIYTLNLDFKENSSHIIDVKKVLLGCLNVTNKLEMLTVVARGDAVACVLLTFIQNLNNRGLALEHSLSPHYYMNGDFARVRQEAFIYSNNAESNL